MAWSLCRVWVALPPTQTMPLRVQAAVNLTAGTSLDLSTLLPAEGSYLTYVGSTTTPPCIPGVLWHVFLEPLYITATQVGACWDARCGGALGGGRGLCSASVSSIGEPPICVGAVRMEPPCLQLQPSHEQRRHLRGAQMSPQQMLTGQLTGALI